MPIPEMLLRMVVALRGWCWRDSHHGPIQDRGKSGELAAYRFLRSVGYKILARNYRRPFGEIDLIGWDDGVLAFVEVKCRAGGTRGLPEEAVTISKQKQICRVAREYRVRHNLRDISYRFDIVAVQVIDGKNQRPRLIKNAFSDQLR